MSEKFLPFHWTMYSNMCTNTTCYVITGVCFLYCSYGDDSNNMRTLTSVFATLFVLSYADIASALAVSACRGREGGRERERDSVMEV